MTKNKVCSHDIIEGIGAGLCLLDKNFRILWVNKYLSDRFGPPRDICGKPCYKIFRHNKRICPGCPILKVFKAGTTQKAKRIGITKDGQKRYYELTISPVKDSRRRVRFALELVEDVTEKVIRQRKKSKIIHKLKRMYRRLSLVNRRLCSNTERLKNITGNMLRFKSIIKKRYRRKINELMAMKEELHDIFKVNHILTSAMGLRKISSLITRLTCELMHTDACVLLLLNEQKKTLLVHASYRMSDAFIKKVFSLRIGEGINSWVAKIGKPLAVYDLAKDSRIKCSKLLKKEGFKSMLSVPVVFQDKILGVISTCSKKRRNFVEEEIEVLSIFASHVAIALQESKYYEDIHMNYFNTIRALVLAVEARDPYTRGHTERVTRYSLEIAHALDMPPAELEILRYAGEVHDIGKISISDLILNKRGNLTPAERAMIELHPVRGVEMLEPLEFLKPALPIVRHHHERYDGTGYPDGLDKEKIPFLSRVIACADSFDAMTSERPYRRRKLTIEEALWEIKNNAGSQFDPKIANLFIKVIKSPPILKASR